MNKKLIWMITCLAFLVALAQPALAQTDSTLSISLSKDFGYSSLTGGQIQGTFSVRAQGPQDLVRVVFYLDGQPLGEVTEAPYRLRFDTSSYPDGKHTLSAIGFTSSGQEIRSNDQVREFVPASQGFEGAMEIILPLLGVIVLAALLAIGIPALFSRGKTKNLPLGTARNYAPLGGTICPKCGRPFAVHIWGLNLLVGKLDRCPYCGKWSMVVRYSPAQLREAELAEMEDAGENSAGIPKTSEEEKLQKDLENSRYQDL